QKSFTTRIFAFSTSGDTDLNSWAAASRPALSAASAPRPPVVKNVRRVTGFVDPLIFPSSAWPALYARLGLVEVDSSASGPRAEFIRAPTATTLHGVVRFGRRHDAFVAREEDAGLETGGLVRSHRFNEPKFFEMTGIRKTLKARAAAYLQSDNEFPSVSTACVGTVPDCWLRQRRD